MNKKELLINATVKYLLGVVLVGLLVFLPAGTLHFRNGWIFMGVLFIPMFLAGIVMWVKDPKLLERRLNAKEKESQQKDVIRYSGLMFMAAFILAGLNYRFGWIVLPDIVIIISVIVFLLAYLLFAEVLRENSYLSRTIRVEEGQKVIDTGLYGIVRHPMYAATVFLFLSMPLVLGSLISFLVMCLYIPIIQKRMVNEEEVLKRELPGYEEYLKKVKYRVFPPIW